MVRWLTSTNWLLCCGGARRFVTRKRFRRSPLGDPITVKQLAVLRLVAAGLDNQEIAGQLAVTLATVKAHVSNICGKLGVTKRRQAVERARQLGIL